MVTSKRVSRPTTPPPHESRNAYLAHTSEADPRICHAISDSRSEPWLTLVLGSGCTPSKNQSNSLLGVAAALAHATSRYAPEAIDGVLVGEVAKCFAQDLIKDRLRGVPGGAEGTKAADVPESLLDLVVASALLTKIYFKIKAIGHDAPRRPDHMDCSEIKQGTKPWGSLDEDYIEPCRKLLQSLKNRIPEITKGSDTADPDPNLVATFCGLLEHIANGLNPRIGDPLKVHLADVHSLAEFTWFYLGKHAAASVYPGWSDLLLHLSHYDAPQHGRVGVPSFQDMTSARKFILDRYMKVTKDSWIATRNGETKADGPGIYLETARLLNAQHEYRHRAFKENNRPPLPTAFVTSFDLELELALLSLGHPFTVALPVHVVTKDNLAHTCWLALKIKSQQLRQRDGLLELLEPSDDNLFVLDKAYGEKGPVVVRLAGCPLMTLPNLIASSSLKNRLLALFETSLRTDAGANQTRLDDILSTLQLQHAVVLNEHDAILQSAIDLLSITGDSPSLLGYHDGPRIGLPSSFAAGSESGFSRFWMMLGVQIHDNAVRHRLATLISALPLTATASSREYSIEDQDKHVHEGKATEANHHRKRCGVTVNNYSTELEQDLLFWNGFDVVKADVCDFTQDLAHYINHLSNHLPFVLAGPCALREDR